MNERTPTAEIKNQNYWRDLLLSIVVFYPTYEGKPDGGWPGTEYCGLKLAKLAAAAANPGKLPVLKPGGNWLMTCAAIINYLINLNIFVGLQVIIKQTRSKIFHARKLKMNKPVDWLFDDEVAANLDKILLSDICNLCATGGILANVAGNRDTSDFMSLSSSSSWLSTLCSTALAGLLPAKLSLLKCWCDSARHSTSAKRAFNDIAGWLGSWVRFR